MHRFQLSRPLTVNLYLNKDCRITSITPPQVRGSWTTAWSFAEQLLYPSQGQTQAIVRASLHGCGWIINRTRGSSRVQSRWKDITTIRCEVVTSAGGALQDHSAARSQCGRITPCQFTSRQITQQQDHSAVRSHRARSQRARSQSAGPYNARLLLVG